MSGTGNLIVVFGWGFLLNFMSGIALNSTNVVHGHIARDAVSLAQVVQTEKSDGQGVKQGNTNEPYRPGAGTLILCVLPKPVQGNKVKVGDLVECDLLQDLIYKGKVVISRRARAQGHITEVSLASKEQPESRVGVVFDKLLVSKKQELPFEHPAIIVALGAPIRTRSVHTTSPSDMPVLMSKGQSTGQSMVSAVDTNPQLAGANMPAVSGVLSAANRGVIGLKGVALNNSNQQFTVITAKGNLNLDFDVQLLLQVTGVAPKNPER